MNYVIDTSGDHGHERMNEGVHFGGKNIPGLEVFSLPLMSITRLSTCSQTLEAELHGASTGSSPLSCAFGWAQPSVSCWDADKTSKAHVCIYRTSLIKA